MSDRLGRRFTLVAAMLAGLGGTALLALGGGIAAFAASQLMIGASTAFISATDSALLYESLAALRREREVERQHLRAWHAAFSTLGVSDVAGGAMGLAPILLLAFGLQIALCGFLALTNSAFAIGLLFLRKAPNALSQPFVMARMQPMQSSAMRANYMSLQSFCGRLTCRARSFSQPGRPPVPQRWSTRRSGRCWRALWPRGLSVLVRWPCQCGGAGSRP